MALRGHGTIKVVMNPNTQTINPTAVSPPSPAPVATPPPTPQSTQTTPTPAPAPAPSTPTLAVQPAPVATPPPTPQSTQTTPTPAPAPAPPRPSAPAPIQAQLNSMPATPEAVTSSPAVQQNTSSTSIIIIAVGIIGMLIATAIMAYLSRQ